MKPLHFFTLLLSALLLFSSCMRESRSVTHAFPEIVPMKDRNSAIGSGEEQAYMEETYAKLADQIRSNPQSLKPRIQMAQFYMVEARATGEHGYYYPAALGMIESVMKLNPDQERKFEAMLLKSSVLLSLHQFAEARSIAEEAISLNGSNSLIYGALVDANVELGNYSKAVEMADKMNAIRPDLRSYSRVSYLREIYGEVDASVEAMKLAVAAALPGSEEAAWCRLTLGKLHETYGNLSEAEQEYRQILSERADYPFAIAALAEIEHKKGNNDHAEELLKKACDIIPEVSFYHQLANLYKESGRTAEAEKTTKEILEMLADDEQHGHKMGLEYARVHLDLTGDYAQALKYAMEEYKTRPDNIDVNKTLAAVYLKTGDVAKAGEHAAKALITRSRNPEALCLAGLAQQKSGNTSEGMRLLKSSIKADPYQQHCLADEARALVAM
ncbi:MAG: hypothetical protein EAZ89_03670 [Bacteroidetes bacterium]|nr:MAG: hypothetical protein EAZ89_03670 [Bacteroidota bacterium]